MFDSSFEDELAALVKKHVDKGANADDLVTELECAISVLEDEDE